ncbi:hypothetical protein EZ456_22760 [Pedobacter psychrodurus]|uniref:Uncharacterized protein n=1 Tax=Pedobacter psychrodurus TaxID=2530456 RepID=A0A4R0PGF0_9SPHI|nr:hypothetical protein [Pedobacter psychrodurus]TCD17641.1 hypothetical protein EZ456_22760 [Pedobacter psychrodurus]
MKKSFLILMLVCFTATYLSAKDVNHVDTSKIYSVKLANTDLKNGSVKFLIRGGIVSIYVKGQELFEKKYAVDYYDFGCIMHANISIEDYNKVVASFMDRKYGRGWRKEVRKDIQGI